MRNFLLISFIALFISSFGQNNQDLLLKKHEEDQKLRAYLKTWVPSHANPRENFQHAKSLKLDRFQYSLEWNDSTQNFDTTARYTFYSDYKGNGIVEYEGFVEYYSPNGYSDADSIYIRVDSNLNLFKLPQFYASAESTTLRFAKDTITKQYRLFSETSIQNNSRNDITRSIYRLHSWDHGQTSSTNSTWDSTNYFYDSNTSLNAYSKNRINFFGPGFRKDTFSVVSNTNQYPVQLSEYESSLFGTFEEITRVIYNYDANNNLTNYQIQDTRGGPPVTFSETRFTYTNNLKTSDSSFDSGALSSVKKFLYTSFNKLDSAVEYFMQPNRIEIAAVWKYNYDSLDRITESIYRYDYQMNNTFTRGTKTSFVYPVESTGINEERLKRLSLTSVPNPIENIFRLEGLKQQTNVTIRTISGMIIKKFSHINHTTLININDLPNSIYFLTTDEGDTVKILKH